MSLPETSTAVAVDRISNLPDDILIHILSSLPPKQAFLTSILSKRWKNLWCYVSDVEFLEAKDSRSKDSFDEFVNYILRSRETAGNHSIRSFILDVKHDSSRLYDIVVGDPPELPYSILTCTTPVVLKLNSIDMGDNFSPFHVTLPSLKTLHLTNITFEQDDDLMNLIEGCPILEDLHLFEVFKGTYAGWNWKTLTMLNRADVTECYISMQAISNVEFLRIRLSRACQDCHFPTFHNLTHLVLNYDWDTVLKMLLHCPKLQNLDLYQIIPDKILGHDYFGRYEFETWAHPKFVPGCLSSNLRTCTMRDFAFGGLQSYHIMLAEFILKNSPVLDTMTIWCSRKRSKIERRLIKRLTSCSRASATCQLSIYFKRVVLLA